jgi:hypothetical protein
MRAAVTTEEISLPSRETTDDSLFVTIAAMSQELVVRIANKARLTH